MHIPLMVIKKKISLILQDGVQMTGPFMFINYIPQVCH